MSLVISVLALMVSAGVAAYNIRESLIASARAVLVAETMAVSADITPEHTSQVVIRNDGSRSVTVESLRYAYGNLRSYDVNRPEVWGFTRLPAPTVLAPGDAFTTPVPSLPPPEAGSAPGIGPVVVLRDERGRRWRLTKSDRMRIRRRPSRWRPLGRAVERWRWLSRLDERIETRQIQKRELRPGALPIVPYIVEALWGWRAGEPGRSYDGPSNAPRRWAFAPGADFHIPRVPPIATYPWGPDPDVDSRGLSPQPNAPKPGHIILP